MLNSAQEFLASYKRFHMFYFPVAAPELNPAEFIWAQAAEYTAGTAPHNGKELQTNVFNAMARTRSSQKRLQDCLLGAHLKATCLSKTIAWRNSRLSFWE
ncbi:MAG TPA: hypothetical protein VLE49_03195 [Anaerolineales bacterium]|nr:hypothetical protein [Anaerolineales bacterium]